MVDNFKEIMKKTFKPKKKLSEAQRLAIAKRKVDNGLIFMKEYKEALSYFNCDICKTKRHHEYIDIWRHPIKSDDGEIIGTYNVRFCIDIRKVVSLGKGLDKL